MAVRLRLARMGSKKKPFYRVVVTDSRNPRDGRFMEHIGIYDPKESPPLVRFKEERLRHWLDRGAIPSVTVASLIKRLPPS